jgi:hypothetical protein
MSIKFGIVDKRGSRAWAMVSKDGEILLDTISLSKNECILQGGSVGDIYKPHRVDIVVLKKK